MRRWVKVGVKLIEKVGALGVATVGAKVTLAWHGLCACAVVRKGLLGVPKGTGPAADAKCSSCPTGLERKFITLH